MESSGTGGGNPTTGGSVTTGGGNPTTGGSVTTTAVVVLLLQVEVLQQDITGIVVLIGWDQEIAIIGLEHEPYSLCPLLCESIGLGDTWQGLHSKIPFLITRTIRPFLPCLRVPKGGGAKASLRFINKDHISFSIK